MSFGAARRWRRRGAVVVWSLKLVVVVVVASRVFIPSAVASLWPLLTLAAVSWRCPRALWTLTIASIGFGSGRNVRVVGLTALIWLTASFHVV